ncbi:MAG: hypothetical protein AABY15_02950 [Nanoarchaeota archaeon]
MSKIAEAYAKLKHPGAKKIKGMHFSYADLGNCYSYVNLSYKVGDKEYSEQLKLNAFFEFIGEVLTSKVQEAPADIDSSIKEYLKENLSIKLDSGYADAFIGRKKVEVKLFLEDEEISQDSYSF